MFFVNALGKTLNMLALGLIISYEPFEQIIMLMADIRRNQMIFWMSLAGLEAFIISKMIYIYLDLYVSGGNMRELTSPSRALLTCAESYHPKTL